MSQLRKRLRRLAAISTALLGAGLGPVVAAATTPLPFIHAQGKEYLDESNKPVLLKGCNLGNWLLIELWMFGGVIQTSDQAHLFAKLDQRFGADRGHQLMDIYRANDITDRDFDQIKSFGFNVVRLPIDYRLLQSDEAPYALKPDGFKWVDRAVDMAEKAGIYIILDMHAVPGGQSNDQCTGESGQNKLWNSEVNQQRTVDVWKAMSERYRDRSNVAGYDLMNEPYADHHMDVRADLRKIMAACYTAIRSTGDQHIMYFPGALGQFPSFYEDPHTAGWSNVGFTEHFYPGMFGDKVAFESHIRTLTRTIPTHAKWQNKVQSPYYVGEFNPVLDSTGGPRITRAYYDAFAKLGWAGTLWSYKLYKPAGGTTANAWYCVSNARPLPKLDLDSSTYEDFEHFFSGLSAIPLAQNRPLLAALTEPDPEPLPLSVAAVESLPAVSAVTNTVAPPGWTTTDIGRSPSGAVILDGDGAITITAGGGDIFGKSDVCRFVSKLAGGNCDFAARISSLLESETYAKAGVMARWGEDPAAAFAMVNAFPDGSIAFITRTEAAAAATEKKIGAGPFPVDLRIAVKGSQATGFYRRASGGWKQIGSASIIATDPCRTGFAVDSHDEDALTKAVFHLIETDSPSPALEPPVKLPSLLKNGSFEDGGSEADIAEGWTRLGSGFHRDISSVAHTGKAGVTYQESRGPSEFSQEVTASPGQRYHASLFALRDGKASDAKVELRLESHLDGHIVTLNSTTVRAAEIGDKWSPLSVDGTAIGNSIRIKVIITPAATNSTGGSIHFDDAVLQIAK